MIGYVKIERCSRSRSWYESMVGKWYPVYRDEGIEWETFEPAGHKNYILKEDVSYVVNEQVTKSK